MVVDRADRLDRVLYRLHPGPKGLLTAPIGSCMALEDTFRSGCNTIIVAVIGGVLF